MEGQLHSAHDIKLDQLKSLIEPPPEAEERAETLSNILTY